jgi:hypothetical protein
LKSSRTTPLIFMKTFSCVSCACITGDTTREVRLFFHQDFISLKQKSATQLTSIPKHVLSFTTKASATFNFHRRARRRRNFATGRKAFRGHEGTWRDAEDGVLAEGAITEGSVDSTVGRALLSKRARLRKCFTGLQSELP